MAKKLKPLSAASISKLVTKHATIAQTTEKVLGASIHTRAINLQLTNISDQHNVLPDNPNVSAENYNKSNGFLFI